MRYEEPSSMVRWDSPLITIPWMDEDIPGDDIWKAIMEGVVKPPNAGTSAVSPVVCPHTLYIYIYIKILFPCHIKYEINYFVV